jgi:hypothetical protein
MRVYITLSSDGISLSDAIDVDRPVDLKVELLGRVDRFLRRYEAVRAVEREEVQA